MDILPGLSIIGLALYTRRERTLLVSDLHIGFEDALHRQGVLMPRQQLHDMEERMGKALRSAARRVVILGDLKHEFGTISRQEWQDTLSFLDMLLARGLEVVLIRGNHDTVLGPLAQKRGLAIVEEFRLGDWLLLHGDQERPLRKDVRAVIIGHEHPAITITDSRRREKYKCFLRGVYRGRPLVVMPSFNTITEGSDIAKEKTLSPILAKAKGIEVFVVADRVYPFGRLDRLL